jgi:SAM-dependent methyltransferase
MTDAYEETMTDAYKDDLAFIHDAGFGDPARNAAPVIVEQLRRTGLTEGLVVDLGCGSGIVAEAIAAAGYDILGIDISSAMISLAQRRVPTGEFRCESLLKSSLPPCVAVSAVGECVNYLFDGRNSANSRRTLFQRVYRSLNPNGIFLFDAAGPGRVPVAGLLKTHREGDGWAVLVTAHEDRQQGTLTRQITSFRQVGALYRRDEELHRLVLVKPSEVAAELRKIGFRVRVLSGYGEMRFPKGWAAFLARKPA